MYLQTKGPTQQLLVKRDTSDNTHYLVVFTVGDPQLITLRLLSSHRLWVNWQRNLRFIGKGRLILMIKFIDWYCLYCFRAKSCDFIGYTDMTYQSVLQRSHDYDDFSVSWITGDNWRVIDAWSIVSYRQWVVLYTDHFSSITLYIRYCTDVELSNETYNWLHPLPVSVIISTIMYMVIISGFLVFLMLYSVDEWWPLLLWD
jgi:hypothetical protein